MSETMSMFEPTQVQERIDRLGQKTVRDFFDAFDPLTDERTKTILLRAVNGETNLLNVWTKAPAEQLAAQLNQIVLEWNQLQSLGADPIVSVTCLNERHPDMLSFQPLLRAIPQLDEAITMHRSFTLCNES